LKSDQTKKRELTKVVKDENFVLGEEKWALEQALGKQQKKSKGLAESLAKSERNNAELLRIVEEQRT